VPAPLLVRFSGSGPWGLQAGDDYGHAVIELLARTVRSAPAEAAEESRTLLLKGPAAMGDADYRCPDLTGDAVQELTCQHLPSECPDHLALNARWALLTVAREAEGRGALLLHGALAEHRGRGVILAGRSDAGKSTASRRLRPPWRSLSDDGTLIVRGPGGGFHAHPWPTWGDVIEGLGSGPWDVSRSIPLDGIFFLTRGRRDFIEPAGNGAALCMLSETADQMSRGMCGNAGPRSMAAARTRRFANAEAIVRTLRCYRLWHTLEGEFWKEIEGATGAADPGAVSTAEPAAAGR